MSARPSPRPGAARGLRREVPALLAGSLLVFVALATFTLLIYRTAVSTLIEERRAEALRVAVRCIEELRRSGSVSAESLARSLPSGAAAALLDASGRELASFGYDAPAGLGIGPLPAAPSAPAAFGPLDLERSPVVALVPFPLGSERRLLRVDLPTATLAASRRGLEVLTPVVLGLSIGAGVLLLLLARALQRPYEQMLARARSLGGDRREEGDELEFLLATFDRALAALSADRAGDLASLHETLGRQVDSGLLLLSGEGDVLAANPVAVSLLGLSGPFQGAPVESALPGHAELASLLRRTVDQGVSVPRAEAHLGTGETQRSLGLVVEALRRPSGEPRGFLVLFADVTEIERQAARDRLASGLAQLGELSAGVAHELRNGIATLSGYLQLARRRPLEPRAEEHLAEAERELVQMRRVVEDFLAFARPGTARLETVDLRAVLDRSAADPALDGIEVDRSFPAEPASILGDAHLLERALKNLLANAAQAERAQGREGPLLLALERSVTGFRITVADRGPGLPPGSADSLFDPFVSHRPGGAGLGLALARRIVLLHGGTVTLSPRPGGGAVARLELPAGGSDTNRNHSGDVRFQAPDSGSSSTS